MREEKKRAKLICAIWFGNLEIERKKDQLLLIAKSVHSSHDKKFN